MALTLFCVGAVVVVMNLRPIAQPVSYHSFAGDKQVFGIPNFWNVSSNLLFVIVGIVGFGRAVARTSHAPAPLDTWCYATLFGSSVLVGIGSMAYHLRPDNNTLVWDRLPMSIAFAAFFSIVLGEHVRNRLGSAVLLPLVGAGILSVWYWHRTESLGRGDLRPYILVQYLPLVLIPLILLLFPRGGEVDRPIWGVLAGYGLAKALELLDRRIFEVTGVVAGHPFKHLVAAAALGLMITAMKQAAQTSEASN